MRDIVNLLNEIGMLEKTPRSGYAFLGSGEQSVAEHSFRMTLVAYTLAKHIEQPVNLQRLLLICLLHDLPEARTGDLNYVNKRYVTANETKVLNDLKNECQLGAELASYIEEYQDKKTLESLIAHDADQIEMMLVLKREEDLGNLAARDWFENAKKRLTLEASKQLAENILLTPSSEWWLKIKHE